MVHIKKGEKFMRKRNYLISVLVLMMVFVTSTFGTLSAGAIELLDEENPDDVRTMYIMHNANTTINIPQESYLHAGKAIEPEVTVTYKLYSGDTYDLIEGKDYTVQYENNVEVGTATIIVTGTSTFDEDNNLYAGKVSKTFAITHDYVDTVVPATADADGYTFHECKLCGYTCKDTFTTFQQPSLEQNSFTLDGTIGANFDYFLPDAYTHGDYEVKVTAVSDKETITVDFDKEKTTEHDGQLLYRFTIPVASCNMTEIYQVKLTVTDSNGNILAQTDEKELKVNKYLASFKMNKALNKLAAALQTYGYYSQVSFNADAEKPIKTPKDVSDVKTSTLRKYQKKVTDYDFEHKISIDKITLLLESETTIRFYISDVNYLTLNNIYLVYTDTKTGITEKSKIKYSRNDGSFYADIPNIGAGKLSNIYDAHFEISGAQISDNVTYGAYSFIFDSLMSGDQDSKNLAAALYQYSLAAEEYLG